MERIADEAGVDPNRISFVVALRFIRDEWFWSRGARSPGAIPAPHCLRVEDIDDAGDRPRRLERGNLGARSRLGNDLNLALQELRKQALPDSAGAPATKILGDIEASLVSIRRGA